MLRCAIIGTAVACFACAGRAQSITFIGSFPNQQPVTPGCMSPDGTVLAGTGWYTTNPPTGTYRAFRWTQAGGIQLLPTLGGSQAQAAAMSADGGRIVGFARLASNVEHACYWSANGSITDLGTFPGAPGYSYARGITPDGATIVGSCSNTPGYSAFRWTQATGLVALPMPPGITFASAAYISDDGSVIGGSGSAQGVPEQAILWINGVPQVIGGLAGDAASAMRFLSADGTVVLGESGATVSIPSPRRVFRWTAATGAQYLFSPPDNVGVSNMSDDGAVIVVGTKIWTASGGLRDTVQVLAEQGIDLSAWTTVAASRISPDGHLLSGFVARPILGGNQGQGWLASFSGGLGCYANCDGSIAPPMLNVNDFVCFLNRFAGGETYANCDQSTAEPVLNVGDFVCFLNRFAAGCP